MGCSWGTDFGRWNILKHVQVTMPSLRAKSVRAAFFLNICVTELPGLCDCVHSHTTCFNIRATSVADIIMLWNFTGPALSRARKWLSSCNKIGRHQPPTSISILCALCSWGKRWCYCLANCNDRGEFSREWRVSVLCVINKFQYIMDSFYSVMGEICFLMIFFSFSEDYNFLVSPSLLTVTLT